MKSLRTFLVLSIFMVGLTVSANAATARLQVIHNAADPAADVVDIYVNGDIFKDDFAFRTATPFQDVPADVELNIGVAPGTSVSADDVIATIPVTLKSGRTYVAIANGVIDPTSFSTNPDAESIGFNLFARDHIYEGSNNRSRVKVIAFHGATDAPTVDITVSNKYRDWRLINNLTYGEFSWYKYLSTKTYIMNVTPGDDNSAIVASYEVDLSGLGGGAAVVFASGFLNPDNNMNGPAFGLFAALPDGSVVEFPAYTAMARLQIIHNAADPAAEVVDIYVNGELFKDDFVFRTATSFMDVPANVELAIGVAPGNSTSSDDIIATIPVTLMANKTYVAIANGVLNPAEFAENPDMMPIGFNLYAQDGIVESAPLNHIVKVIAFHGATDAPTVDVMARGKYYNSVVFNNLSYGEFSSYGYLKPKPYLLNITPGNDNDAVVVTFNVDLTGLGGGAAVVFASGFLSPADNMNGAGFGLFAALADGNVVEFPVYEPTARLQVIHNAADPAAEVVDIYVNGALFKDDFAFRTATEFLDVPAGVELNIGVAPGNSVSVADALAEIPVTLEEGKTYVAIANGVLDPNDFADNPDGRSIGFALYPRDEIRESAKWNNLVDLIVFHGATDAPAVDVMIQKRYGFGFVNDLAYGEFSDYRKLWPWFFTLDVTPAGDNNTVVASFEADLTGLNGGAAVVFASGFLSPADNMNGAEFGLFAALPDGNVVELPKVTPMARLQIIHNAADPASEVVDIYVNGALFKDDFAFRTATAFMDVPAGVELNIGVAPGTSMSSDDIIATIPVTLDDGKTYVAIANGVLNPDMFTPNPDGRAIGFNLYATDNARESCGSSRWVKLNAFHGATDAPSVDIRIRGDYYSILLFNDLGYGEYSGYRAVRPVEYILDVYPADDRETVVASFEADLDGLGGGAAVVFASGFLGDDGVPFGLFAALPDGVVIELPMEEAGDDENGDDDKSNDLAKANDDNLLPEDFQLNQNYPNPFNPSTTISFSLPKGSDVTLRVYNVLGQQVETVYEGRLEAGVHQINYDASRLSSGMYFYRINAGEYSDTRKMMLLK